jgi:hypothetical protein
VYSIVYAQCYGDLNVPDVSPVACSQSQTSGELKFAARKGYDCLIFRNRNLAIWLDQCSTLSSLHQLTISFPFPNVLESYLNPTAMRLLDTLCVHTELAVELSSLYDSMRVRFRPASIMRTCGPYFYS